ncbi:hypothetical protein D0862_14857 [Hortaea werneckii]|uniref:Fe2OG dioxygenase domain-containing protein n=1 Tax=Hortaea werneckii TaxID=91943 RepID=A0A3M7E018_HORWE|nr:hypothetical protein D0862_14857 [Hortaea werneckii]
MAAASASTSTATPTELDYLEGFEEALQKESRKATFTCAGRLPINLNPNLTPSGDLTPRTNLKVHEQTLTTKPIRIRWGPNHAGKTLSLPLQTPEDAELLQDLIAACHPATFGRAGHDVYDPTYRLAGALGPADFLTDFCPYETGSLDLVTQLLLPPIVGDLEPKGRVSDEGNEFGLMVEEDRKLHAALETQQNCVGSPESPEELLRALLQDLDIPFVDEDEAKDVEDRLERDRQGEFFLEDVFAVAAARLVAKRASATPAELHLHSETRRRLCRGLRAELYKLNVYSAPGGVFKPHVDTPRSATQIGSLVVCLPVEFSGGELAVRHSGQEVVHDWGQNNNTNNPPAAFPAATHQSTAPPPPPAAAINWTAFYSDCAHEVRPVQTGHRLTLTYNLFLSAGTGLLGTQLPQRLLPDRLPLVPHLRRALVTPDFKPQGGFLAFWLRHRYPHTQPVGCEFVAEMLKGGDLGVLAAVRAVGLRCSVERVEHFPGGRDVLDEGVWGRLLGDGSELRRRGAGTGMVVGGDDDDGRGRIMREEGLRNRPGEEEEEGEDAYGGVVLGRIIPSSLCPLEIGDDPLNEAEYGEPDESDFDVSSSPSSPEDSDEEMHPIVEDVVARLRRQKKERLTWIGREGRPEAEVSGVYLAVSCFFMFLFFFFPLHFCVYPPVSPFLQ